MLLHGKNIEGLFAKWYLGVNLLIETRPHASSVNEWIHGTRSGSRKVARPVVRPVKTRGRDGLSRITQRTLGSIAKGRRWP